MQSCSVRWLKHRPADDDDSTVTSVLPRHRLTARARRESAATRAPWPTCPQPDVAALDLSLRSPGQLAASLADRARAQAPLRSALARALSLPSTERLLREAARRERHVAALLDSLENGWHAVHGIPLDTIDTVATTSPPVHLLVGAGGAYAVVGTAPRADVRVDGDLFVEGTAKRAEVVRARRRAYRAATALSAVCGASVAVSGLVIVTAPSTVVVEQSPHRVEVVSELAVLAWAAARPQVLSRDDVAAVHAAASRSDTWAT